MKTLSLLSLCLLLQFQAYPQSVFKRQVLKSNTHAKASSFSDPPGGRSTTTIGDGGGRGGGGGLGGGPPGNVGGSKKGDGSISTTPSTPPSPPPSIPSTPTGPTGPTNPGTVEQSQITTDALKELVKLPASASILKAMGSVPAFKAIADKLKANDFNISSELSKITPADFSALGKVIAKFGGLATAQIMMVADPAWRNTALLYINAKNGHSADEARLRVEAEFWSRMLGNVVGPIGRGELVSLENFGVSVTPAHIPATATNPLISGLAVSFTGLIKALFISPATITHVPTITLEITVIEPAHGTTAARTLSVTNKELDVMPDMDLSTISPLFASFKNLHLGAGMHNVQVVARLIKNDRQWAKTSKTLAVNVPAR
ncbi:hypothetical protein MON38_10660 [Hymenobacter sp. DH14]|uniref:Uncharacterized protein n=1 Tax=Hymenobacter cyanobacteriorum TaxID=2926463 RepID=A0A9X2AFI0_9BACT|nr:hypothetical protein [Hymenobacter cyanobacteriorum]MCI1187882.1 hypothetical protein [Hymenobacter cyanobacteriorum]